MGSFNFEALKNDVAKLMILQKFNGTMCRPTCGALIGLLFLWVITTVAFKPCLGLKPPLAIWTWKGYLLLAMLSSLVSSQDTWILEGFTALVLVTLVWPLCAVDVVAVFL